MYIFWILLVLVIIISFYFYSKEKKSINDIFKKIASSTDAHIKESLFSYPQLTLSYKNTTILISALSGGQQGSRPPQSFAQFPIPDTWVKDTFILQSKSIQTAIDKALGYSHVSLGIPEIDNKFFIYAKNETYVKSLFTKEIQDSILKLDSRHGIKVGIENADYYDGKVWTKALRFDATIFNISTEYEEYINLINTAKLFYDKIKTKVVI